MGCCIDSWSWQRVRSSKSAFCAHRCWAKSMVVNNCAMPKTSSNSCSAHARAPCRILKPLMKHVIVLPTSGWMIHEQNCYAFRSSERNARKSWLVIVFYTTNKKEAREDTQTHHTFSYRVCRMIHGRVGFIRVLNAQTNANGCVWKWDETKLMIFAHQATLRMLLACRLEHRTTENNVPCQRELPNAPPYHRFHPCCIPLSLSPCRKGKLSSVRFIAGKIEDVTI